MSKWRKPWGRELRWNRSALVRRDGAVCQLCKEPIVNMREATIDHITPVSLGGTDRLDNLRLAHEFCNTQRGAGFFKPSATVPAVCPPTATNPDDASHTDPRNTVNNDGNDCQ